MQYAAATIAFPSDSDRGWLAVATKHSADRTITASEFAMHAVGSLLLQDIATSPPSGSNVRA